MSATEIARLPGCPTDDREQIEDDIQRRHDDEEPALDVHGPKHAGNPEPDSGHDAP